MTVVSLGDHQVLEQIQKQLGKLEDVHHIKALEEGHSVYRELMMVKVRADAAMINLLEDYEILELARTGLTGLSRGSDDVRYLP